MNMQKLQIDANTPDAVAWANTVGGFFRNFGVIELIITEFLKRMAVEYKYKSMKKKFLSQKLSWIIDGLSDRTNADKGTIRETIEVLEEIRGLSIFRNVLAHAAAGFDVSEPSGEQAPALVGALNFKPEDEDEESELIPLEEIKEKAAESEALAKRLLGLLNGMELTQAPE